MSTCYQARTHICLLEATRKVASEGIMESNRSMSSHRLRLYTSNWNSLTYEILYKSNRSFKFATSLGYEADLHREFFLLLIPVSVKFSIVMIDLKIRDLECYILIRFGSEYQVLIIFLWDLNFLLVRGHNSVPRSPVDINLLKIYLKQQRFLF